MVCGRGRGEPVVRDLVGAYDINHPTLLLTNTYSGDAPLGKLSREANRVGLKTKYLLALAENYVSIDNEWGNGTTYREGSTRQNSKVI